MALALDGPLEQAVHDRTMSRRSKGHADLERRIGHQFADRSLLTLALTHVSAMTGPQDRVLSYQRLEFLGDHVLGLAVSAMLYRAFPNAHEGELSHRLADLVRRETCGEMARAMDLGPSIALGPSESQGGGRKRTAILADVCEALIGAVFIDGGYAAASALVERFWQPRMLASSRPQRDSKTVLQEWAQGLGLPAPTYREVGRTGPHHDPEFRVMVQVSARDPAEGVGGSKRAAEQAAASAMLAREGVADAADD